VQPYDCVLVVGNRAGERASASRSAVGRRASYAARSIPRAVLQIEVCAAGWRCVGSSGVPVGASRSGKLAGASSAWHVNGMNGHTGEQLAQDPEGLAPTKTR
jgi:hypothetical protein